MKSTLTLLAAAAACVGTMQAAEPALTIYSGAPDTVRTATTVLVGVTEPGASVTVNGTAVHVYKTGSFGTKIDLTPGVNHIKVDATLNGESTARDLTVVRAEPKAKAAAPEAAPIMMYAAPRVIETLPGAYLQYGDGDDRLGGSKMGFVDPGIRLAVTGKRGSLYQVRLGVDRVAYIPDEYAKFTEGPVPTVANTGSWSVSNTGKADRVSVALPHRMAWHATTSLQPNEICIDIFGAFDNSNWITQRTLDLGIIDYVDFRQISDDVYRVIIRLKGDLCWGFNVGYAEGSSSLNIDVRHRPASLDLRNLTIGLDAGHGGIYSGAVSPSGIKEKDVNLDIVERLKALLEKKGATVVMTRTDDSGPSMAERKRVWANAGVDISISVHNNAGGTALDSPGTSVYYKHLFCRPFAEAMCRRMLQTGLPLYGLVGNFNFSLVGPTICPTCLVEGAFMSSLAEEEKLADPNFRQLMAQKILDGLTDYLKAAK